MKNQSYKNKYKSLLIILSGTLLISIGIWDASIPLGDEAGYIADAISLLEEGNVTLNLYILNYIGIFKFLTSDPITAHIICRFYTSILSMVFMYLFLKSFKSLKNEYAILTVTAFWGCCKLNIPYVQFGNINLFALNIVFPSLILIMRKITLNRALFFLLSCLWAAQTRIEYLGPFVLSFIFFLILSILKIKRSNWKIEWKKHLKTSSVMALLLVASFVFIKSSKEGKSFADMDRHLLLGLEQCYTSLYSKFHHEKKISTMVEYKLITDKVFNKPTGFVDACRKNPLEVAKYLTVNGAINAVILIPALLRHRALIIPEKFGEKGEIIQIAILLLFIAYGTVIGLRPVVKDKLISRADIISFILNSKLWILLFLCTSGSVSILLHIPDGRYWITFIPLLFIFITWSIQQLYQRINYEKIKKTVCIFLLIIFLHPMFLFGYSNQPLIKSIRVKQKTSTIPVIAGLYPNAIGTYAFKNKKKIITVKEFDINKIKDGNYDFVIINTYFRNSSFFNKNIEFFSEFEKSPEHYNYECLGTTQDKYKLSAYSKLEDTKKE